MGSPLVEMLDELEGLLSEHGSVSTRWYARHASMPVDESRALLDAFLKQRGAKAEASYMLGGKLKGGTLSFQLVGARDLAEAKKLFENLTTEQVYSIHSIRLDAVEPLASLNSAQDMELYEQLRQTGENNCLLDNRWSQIKNEAAKISAVGARIKPASLPANTVAPKQAAPALTKPAPIPKEAAAMFASKPKPAPSSSGGQKGCAAVKPSVVAKSSLAAKPAAPAPTPSTSASASAPIAVSTNSKKRRAIESDEEDEEVEPTVAKSCAKDEMAVKERPVSEKNADEKNSPPVAAPAAGKTKPGGVAAMFAARTAVEANTTAINKDGGQNSNTEIRSGSFEHVTAAAVQGTIKKGGEKAHPVSNPSKKQVAVGAKPHAKDHVDTSQTPQRSEVGARAAAETTEMCAYSSGKRAADAHEEEEAERKRRKEERRKARILEDAATLEDAPGSLVHPHPPANHSPAVAAATLSPGAPLKTPQANGGNSTSSITKDGDDAISRSAARTIIVKERVREEVTYMDERGYMICEERWVEKEVEKEVPDAPNLPLKPSSSFGAQKTSVKPSAASSRPAKKTSSASDEDDDETQLKPKKSGAQKTKKAPPNAGMRSIGSFFGKK